MRMRFGLACAVSTCLTLAAGRPAQDGETFDLARATVVTRAGNLPKAERAATQVLVEELEKRIGMRLAVSTSWPKDGLVVAVTAGPADPSWNHAVPQRAGG